MRAHMAPKHIVAEYLFDTCLVCANQGAENFNILKYCARTRRPTRTKTRRLIGARSRICFALRADLALK